MASFLQEKNKAKTKQLTPEENKRARIAYLIIFLLLMLFTRFIFFVIGGVIVWFVIKFVPTKKLKIIFACIVVIASIVSGSLWLQKVSKDDAVRKAQHAIVTAQKAEQKQKDDVEKTKQNTANQEAKAKQAAADQAAQAKADAQAKEQTVSELTPVCVASHKSLFKPKIDELLNGSGIDYQSRSKGAYSTEDCKKIIAGLFDLGYKKDEIKNVAGNNIWIGMDFKELICSVGLPNDINNTTSAFTSHHQLIYGDPLNGAIYVYVDNGKVTSYQD